MNDEGLSALVALFCFYFKIHYSLIGVHDSINEALCHCDAVCPWPPVSRHRERTGTGACPYGVPFAVGRYTEIQIIDDQTVYRWC